MAAGVPLSIIPHGLLHLLGRICHFFIGCLGLFSFSPREQLHSAFELGMIPPAIYLSDVPKSRRSLIYSPVNLPLFFWYSQIPFLNTFRFFGFCLTLAFVLLQIVRNSFYCYFQSIVGPPIFILPRLSILNHGFRLTGFLWPVVSYI